MKTTEILKILKGVIKNLEESGDIVVVNPIENAVPKKILSAIENLVPTMLSKDELAGVINAIGAHQLGFALDDRDFQTIIGLTKKELEIAANKLQSCHE